MDRAQKINEIYAPGYEEFEINKPFSPDSGYIYEWGNYDNQPQDRRIVVWLPAVLKYKAYQMEDIQKITLQAKELMKGYWQGPINSVWGWKFRFSSQEDLIVFKMIV